MYRGLRLNRGKVEVEVNQGKAGPSLLNLDKEEEANRGKAGTNQDKEEVEANKGKEEVVANWVKVVEEVSRGKVEEEVNRGRAVVNRLDQWRESLRSSNAPSSP